MTAARSEIQPDDAPVSLLEAALWRQLAEADDFAQFCSAWIALQCGMMAGATHGLITLGDDKPKPVAVWPEGSDDADMLAVAALAIAQKRGVIQRAEDAPTAIGGRCDLAYPLMVKGVVRGAAVISLRGEPDLRLATRKLQWGTAWLRERLIGNATAEAVDRSRTSSLALELLAVALDNDGCLAASRAVATALAHKFGCERVSFGFLRGDRIHVAVISHSAQFGRHMNLVRLIGDAMDEAVDQRAAILHPAAPGEPHVTRAHAKLSAAQTTETVLTIPLMAHDRFVGAVTFERKTQLGFSADEITVLDGVVCALAPILEEKRRNDRWLVVKIAEAAGQQFTRLLGPGHWQRKIAAVAAVIAVVAGYWFTDTYRVTAEAAIEGRIQRAVVAPFNGFLKEAPARAGDQVVEGQTLASLDDRDLMLERLRWVTERQRKVLEHEKALGDRNRAEVKIIATQIEQADAQIQLVDEHLIRARVTTPFAGLVVSGDLTQSIGATVQRGQVLFEIAPLDSYRVMLDVDETQIGDIWTGQSGRLVVSSLPNEIFSLTVAKVTPVAKAHDGRNFFRVEARLDDAAPQLRPGMRGAAKLDVDERRVVWIWTRSFVEWSRLQLWRWSG